MQSLFNNKISPDCLSMKIECTDRVNEGPFDIRQISGALKVA